MTLPAYSAEQSAPASPYIILQIFPSPKHGETLYEGSRSVWEATNPCGGEGIAIQRRLTVLAQPAWSIYLPLVQRG